MSGRGGAHAAQAWVRLRADDPAAVSALGVARRSLAAGRALSGLGRFRLFELLGPLPGRAELEDLLHRSSRFYNPIKEECRVRMATTEPAPVGADERAVLVSDRGLERRPAAERWWAHVTGAAIEVREGVVWVLRFESGVDTAAAAADLAVLRDHAHGLLCNPNAQDHRLAGSRVPLPWIAPGAAGEEQR